MVALHAHETRICRQSCSSATSRASSIARGSRRGWRARLRLAGLIIIRDEPGRLWRAARREIRRVGLLAVPRRRRLPAVRAPAPGRTGRRVGRRGRWRDLRQRYPADLDAVPRIVVSSPNSDEARAFSRARSAGRGDCALQGHPEARDVPDAACRARSCCIPGICPGIPQRARMLLGAGQSRSRPRRHDAASRLTPASTPGRSTCTRSCDFDEVRESHIVIQHRVVFENLDAIGRILLALCRGDDVSHDSDRGTPFRHMGAAAPDRVSALEARRSPQSQVSHDAGPYRCCFMTSTRRIRAKAASRPTAADRYKLALRDFDAQLAGLASVRAMASLIGCGVAETCSGTGRV